MSSEGNESKFFPVIVTVVPKWPESGNTEVITGLSTPGEEFLLVQAVNSITTEPIMVSEKGDRKGVFISSVFYIMNRNI
jgi:hypothetical protein